MPGLDTKKFTIDFAGRPLTLEVSRLAEQANGAVIGIYGDTVVLATVTMGKKETAGDFLPLTVEYEQKFYAAGKILGSRFVRREGRAPDSAVLSGRLIDRTIRPLFDHRMRREIQVVVSVLSFDEENSHEFVGLVAVSAALAISDIPWAGPVAGVPVAEIDGKIVVAPKFSELKNATLESFVAGTAEHINMIELEGRECLEEGVIAAYAKAQEAMGHLIALQERMVKEIGKSKQVVKLVEANAELAKAVREFVGDKLEAAIYTKNKMEREANMLALRKALGEHLVEAKYDGVAIVSANGLIDELIDELVHAKMLKENKRPDGRAQDEIRELYGQVHMYERLHGSAIFMRGNTQAFAVTTLASTEAGKLVETMDYTGTKHFLLHYNFPPYSVGEVKPFRGPGRREIGHGALAEKAIANLVPAKEVFPYTIRVV